MYLQAYRDLAVKSSSTLDTFVLVKVDEKALNAYRWMEWIVQERRELSFCEKKRTRMSTNLKPICAKILKSYLFALENSVRDRIKVHL